MDCTFEELIHLYTLSKAYVSVRELEEAGLVKEFCNRVEKIAPTQDGYLNHWKMFDSFESSNFYFGLAKVQHGAITETFCSATVSPPSDIMIAHLIDDVPPVDMEGLLTE